MYTSLKMEMTLNEKPSTFFFFCAEGFHCGTTLIGFPIAPSVCEQPLEQWLHQPVPTAYPIPSTSGFLCSCSISTKELLKWLSCLLTGQNLLGQSECARGAGKLKPLGAADFIGRLEWIGAQKLRRHVGIDR